MYYEVLGAAAHIIRFSMIYKLTSDFGTNLIFIMTRNLLGFAKMKNAFSISTLVLVFQQLFQPHSLLSFLSVSLFMRLGNLLGLSSLFEWSSM